MHVIVRIQWLAGNVVFPAGEARQRMHIKAARLDCTPIFGKNGATTKTYGVGTRFMKRDPVMVGEKRCLPGRAR